MLFISSIEALSELVASNSRESLLIGGELVLLSHDKSSAANIGELTDRYVAQPPRMASRKSIFDKGKKSLYVSIDKQAVEMMLAYRGQIALSADQYLAYGLSQKSNVIVIGGGKSSVSGNISLEGFVFTEQSLVDTFERSAPLSGYMLDLVLKGVIRQYPDHLILWCDPLDSVPVCDISQSALFKDVGSDPIKSLVKRKIFSRKQSEEEGWGVLPALGVAIFGFLVFAGVTGYQWQKLETERAEYNFEIGDYEEAYRVSSDSLELLRHRDFLLSTPSESSVKVALLDNLIVRVAGIKNVLIHSIRVTDEGSDVSDDNPYGDKFILDVSIPKEVDLGGARQQAEELVKKINSQLGMTVRVISHSSHVHREGSQSAEYWRYILGGSQ